MHPSQLLVFLSLGLIAFAPAQPENVWPGLAPGESTEKVGETLPKRKGENPPATRVVNISKPTFTVHLADKPNGAGAVILPGGGFGKVVTDKEGTEAAAWLNKLGVSAFVLSYRTSKKGDERPPWLGPLQDAQRTLSVVRAKAKEYKIDPNRLGLIGFSAGGHVAARCLSVGPKLAYTPLDRTDETSHLPNFAMLIYPWRIFDPETNALIKGAEVKDYCPPTFIAHTDDDAASSLSAVLFYKGLKERGISSELHVYGNGGHGYGLRPVKGSQISTWPDHAGHWLLRWVAKNEKP